ATPAPAAERRYTVQPGDTLRSIAEQFNVSVAALLEANDLTPAQADNLRPGQELIIPPSSS
ncbi:MAG TPA: LysM peptidoglycan-binding domain-containing protein, partial [Roseiflexaceae bacterium]|nr:LysM peptidoglycan-binding domain-containing protein [Roseiflexaceae bacterium]